MFTEIGPFHKDFTGVKRRFRFPKGSLVIPSQIWIAGVRSSNHDVTIRSLRLNEPTARPDIHSLKIGSIYRIEDMPPTFLCFTTSPKYGGLQAIIKTIQKYYIIPEEVYIREYLTSLN